MTLFQLYSSSNIKPRYESTQMDAKVPQEERRAVGGENKNLAVTDEINGCTVQGERSENQKVGKELGRELVTSKKVTKSDFGLLNQVRRKSVT